MLLAVADNLVTTLAKPMESSPDTLLASEIWFYVKCLYILSDIQLQRQVNARLEKTGFYAFVVSKLCLIIPVIPCNSGISGMLLRIIPWPFCSDSCKIDTKSLIYSNERVYGGGGGAVPLPLARSEDAEELCGDLTIRPRSKAGPEIQDGRNSASTFRRLIVVVQSPLPERWVEMAVRIPWVSDHLVAFQLYKICV